MSQDMQPHVGACTDVGQVRRQNEDSLIEPPPTVAVETLQAKGLLYGVADGMGGEAGGKVASQTAAAAVAAQYYRDPDTDIARSLRRAVQEANRAVYQETQRNPALSRMGTTMTAVVIRGDSLTLAHVGDSRAYLIRGGQAQMLSAEHTRVAELVQSGALTLEQAQRHPDRHVLTRALGADPRVDIDVRSEKLLPGDRVVLCSDGLSNIVEPPEILAAVEAQPPDAAARTLVALANKRGGPDNISVVVAQIGNVAPAPVQTRAPVPWLLLLVGAALALALVVGLVVFASNVRAKGGGSATATGLVAVAVVPPTTPTDTPTLALTRAAISATPAPSASASVGATVNADNVNLRPDPSARNAPLGTLDRGEKLTLRGRSADGQWLYVTTPKQQQGWVAVRLVDGAGSLDGLTIVTPTAVPATATMPAPTRLPTVAPAPPQPSQMAQAGGPPQPIPTRAQAAPTPAPTVAPTDTPSPTPAIEVSLSGPDNNATIDGMVQLNWWASQPLAEDETFDVRVCRGAGCTPQYGVTTVTTPSYGWCPAEKSWQPGMYQWQVAVIEKASKESKGTPSEVWSFKWQEGCGQSGEKDKPSHEGQSGGQTGP